MGFPATILERHRACDLECNFRRIHLVVRTVVQRDLDIFDFVSCEYATLHGFLDALFNGLDVFPGNGATYDAIHENKSGANAGRLNRDSDMTVLAAATGLANVLAFGIGLRSDR